MFRSYLVFGIPLFVILIVCGADKPTISKRLQKCLGYITQAYGQTAPNCDNSPGSSGVVIENQEFPSIALLGFKDDESICWKCHGTLISSRYILAAGHCLKYPGLTKVRLGAATVNICSNETNTLDYDIDAITVHPLYKRSALYNDIGLIKLSRQVDISENVRPICLPDSDLQSNTLFEVNYSAKDNAQQWQLIKSEQNAVSNGECNELLLPIMGRKTPNGITDEILCSRSSSNTLSEYSGIGESGAPLYIDHAHVPCSHIQLGIVSFGLRQATDLPNGATKVYSFSDWIESVIWADGEDA